MNIYCDLMHDVLEGVCRYVIPVLLNCFIYQRKLFSLDMLNSRIASFSYDHSSRPPCLTAEHIKKCTVTISAMEMLNLVLALNIMIGDVVVECREWEVYLMLRNIVLYCCGLVFCEEELVYFEVVIAEFLEEYMSVFGGPLTLKFHNLTHYPRVIKYLGPMYHNWVMRCEAKHSDLKKAASAAGNFKNISRTLAVRHQMKQAERFFACRGVEGDCFPECVVGRVQRVTLGEINHGSKISALLGNYGLYREIFRTEAITVNSVCFRTGDILVFGQDGNDDIFPTFCQVYLIFVTDSRDYFLVCMEMCTLVESHHYQAYEVLLLDKLTVVNADSIAHLASPWPLKLREAAGSLYVSVRHKI